MNILVVIPTYNEVATIVGLIQEILSVINAEILVVDDNSPDGTGALADAYAEKDTRVHCLHRPGKNGLGTAYREGFQWALERDYTYIIQMDGDGSHAPEYIPELIKAAADRDVVLGSRYVRGGSVSDWSTTRKLLSICGNIYIRALLQLRDRRYRFHDSTSGFKCWRADFLKSIDLGLVRSEGYAFQIEMNWYAVQHDARIREMPIKFSDRIQGKSKVRSSGILATFVLPFMVRKLKA